MCVSCCGWSSQIHSQESYILWTIANHLVFSLFCVFSIFDQQLTTWTLVKRMCNTRLRIPQDWKSQPTCLLAADWWNQLPLQFTPRRMFFPSARSSLPNYRQQNLQDGRSIALTTIKQFAGTSCVNTWPYKRGWTEEKKVRQQDSPSCCLALGGSYLRWEEGEDGEEGVGRGGSQAIYQT